MRDRYRMCDQTVTVYHRAGADDVERRVLRRAFLDAGKSYSVSRTGSAESGGFLLVVPGDAPVWVGDKVLRGEGPECEGDAQWRELVPTRVDGLVVVKSVDRHPEPRGGGRIAHTEAGG